MEVMVDYLGAAQFEVTARKHTLVSDQPEENGGFNEGMTPPELMLASLGTCAGYYAAEYLKAQHLSGKGMRIHVKADKAKAPARLASFRIELQMQDELGDRHRDGILRAVHACLIHNTLLNTPSVEFDVTCPVHAGSLV